jgi:hypothetical protein
VNATQKWQAGIMAVALFVAVYGVLREMKRFWDE